MAQVVSQSDQISVIHAQGATDALTLNEHLLLRSSKGDLIFMHYILRAQSYDLSDGLVDTEYSDVGIYSATINRTSAVKVIINEGLPLLSSAFRTCIDDCISEFEEPICEAEESECEAEECKASVCKAKTSVCKAEASVCKEEASVCEEDASVCEEEASECKEEASGCEAEHTEFKGDPYLSKLLDKCANHNYTLTLEDARKLDLSATSKSRYHQYDVFSFVFVWGSIDVLIKFCDELPENYITTALQRDSYMYKAVGLHESDVAEPEIIRRLEFLVKHGVSIDIESLDSAIWFGLTDVLRWFFMQPGCMELYLKHHETVDNFETLLDYNIKNILDAALRGLSVQKSTAGQIH